MEFNASLNSLQKHAVLEIKRELLKEEINNILETDTLDSICNNISKVKQ